MIGRAIGNYRVVSLLGEGGMGIVYLAEHVTIERKVAIKLLRSELMSNGDATTRFLNEARVASTIRHPNIIEVFDTGVLSPEGVPYIVMDVLQGEPLDDRLARVKRLEVPLALRWANETALALAAAHAKGVVHRDLKPANLFVVSGGVEGGESETIKVLDFGIAKARAGVGITSHTQTGSIMGTPVYMSPEQCAGARDIDTRSDIYSLGVILYEMLCGRPPFVAHGMGELISMHLTVPPPSPRTYNPELDEGLAQVVLRALAKNPDERFATVQDLQTALGFRPSTTSSGENRETPARMSAGAPVAGRATAATGTRVMRGSVLVTPSAGASALTTKPPSRRGRAVAIAGGGLGAVVLLLAILHQQVGPRLSCLTGKSCLALGDCYWGGDCGITKDVKRACDLYDQDCNAGHLEACVRDGRCAELRTGVVPTDWKVACDLYEKGCTGEQAVGCGHLSDCYRIGAGERPLDLAQSCALARRGCDSGDQYGCAQLGLCYRDGAAALVTDKQKACDLFKSACDSSELLGCAWMADTCYAGGPFAGGDEEACHVADRACGEGGRRACTVASGCYSQGKGGLPRSDRRGCELASTACDRDGFLEAAGCSILAGCYFDGLEGYPRDAGKAVGVLTRPCNAGDSSACFEAATIVNDGRRGAPVDRSKACGLFEKACAGGRGCLESARCACRGLDGGTPSQARAQAFYQKACAAGDRTACEESNGARCGEAAPVAAAAPDLANGSRLPAAAVAGSRGHTAEGTSAPSTAPGATAIPRTRYSGPPAPRRSHASNARSSANASAQEVEIE